MLLLPAPEPTAPPPRMQMLLGEAGYFLDAKGDSSWTAALSATVSLPLPIRPIPFVASHIDLLISGASAAVQEFWEHVQDCRLGFTVLTAAADSAVLVEEGEHGLLFRLTNVTHFARAILHLSEMYPLLMFAKR